MNRAWQFVLSVWVVLAATGCNSVDEARLDAGIESAITYGDVDYGNSYPHVGAFVAVRDDGALGQICSGTLIHPRIFLTAGHCTAFAEDLGLPVERIKVNFDLYALNTETVLDVEQVITHPSYGAPGWAANAYDLGVLILQEAVTDVEPAALAPLGFLNRLQAEGKLRQGSRGAKFTVAGYGVQEWEARGFAYDGLRRIAQSEFLNLRKAWLLLSQNQATGDAGTCFGDSGGPTFWTNSDGREVLVAITSWGDARCVATGETYRTDIPESLAFIETVIENLP